MTPLSTTAKVGRDQFMHLLVTQMRHQNPLDPIKDGEFVAQLAQFSSLEGIEKLNANFSEMLRLQELTQSANLLGRTALFQRLDSETPGAGEVREVLVQDGAVNLMIGSELVRLAQIRGLAS